MFFIYDVRGLQFSGDLQALKKRRKVESVTPIEPFSVEAKESSVREEAPFLIAANAYKKQEQSETVEPLVYAYEIMSEPVITLEAKAPLSAAWDVFQIQKVRHLPILNSQRQILGIISDRDVLRYLLVEEENRIVQQVDLTAEQAIRHEVLCAHPQSEIRQLAVAMVHSHRGCIPILDEGGGLLGIVTRGDILRGFVDHPRLNLWG